jgi:hypothetical protein
MKKRCLLLLLTLALTGCAGSPLGNLINNERQETKKDVMASWVGASEDGLVVSWGPPDNSYTLSSGAKLISYEYIWGVYVGQRFQCVEKFMIENGKVTKWGMASSCRQTVSNAKLISKDTPIPQPTL